MLIFSVYDKKAMVFFPPFTCENKVVALRSLESTVNSSGNVINAYPDDFALYYLGEFDDKKGVISQPDIKILECECRQLVRPALNRQDIYPADEKLEAPSGAGAAN